jgi:hypothetical protein
MLHRPFVNRALYLLLLALLKFLVQFHKQYRISASTSRAMSASSLWPAASRRAAKSVIPAICSCSSEISFHRSPTAGSIDLVMLTSTNRTIPANVPAGLRDDQVRAGLKVTQSPQA